MITTMAEILGPTYIQGKMLQVYSALPETAREYKWIVDGGKILYGQGSRAILVDWRNSGIGSIELDIITDDGQSDALVITVKVDQIQKNKNKKTA
jgi:hypothetical protein